MAALMIFYLFELLYFLRHFNDGVIDGTILDALAAAGIIAFGWIDHTDLIQIIDCLARTKMDTGSASDTLLNYDYVCHMTTFQDIRNSWIEAAAFLPRPWQLITVAAPVAISPPAQTLSLDVLPVALSMTMFPFLPMVSPGVVGGINGLGLLPIAWMTQSNGSTNSDPGIATGLRLPEASGSPNSICRHSNAVTLKTVIADGSHRQGQVTELDAFLFRIFNFFQTRRQLCA